MQKAEAGALADELYQGASRPLSDLKRAGTEHALEEEWWRSGARAEGTASERYLGALRLYVEIGHRYSHPLNAGEFPAVFDFGDGAIRPGKGATKAFLDNGLITSRRPGAQLVFALTDMGRCRLDQTQT